MRLHIRRDQSKGMLGGVTFEVSAKVGLSDQEADLVKRYKVHKETLLKRQINILGRTIEFSTTIGNLIDGQTYKCGDIAEILETEKNVKEACQNFKTMLTVMSEFGGEEVIDY
jgi:hypothetical protein